MQDRIARELKIDRTLVKGGEAKEIQRRIDFIKTTLRESGCKALVLGISGGVDSLTAGRLCQLAVEQLRDEGYTARFIAMRLPYKTQADESDAQASLDYIVPDHIDTLNIAAGVDGLMASLSAGDANAAQLDFIKGNVKARTRMIAQYAVANLHNGLVVGTDHGAEALMGFFTKFGDGACDLAPLSGLTKTQVRLLASALDAPANLVHKHPTADLEELAPGKLDEAAYGCSYAEIDAYLMGEPVSEQVRAIVEGAYRKTAHKRALPVAP
ncbi:MULTISPECIES: ammonia-dependent NAD(+) synthetase [Pseudomonas]|jgi:NAD+ synthase|uniref:NH(3)-dependent NAD(+) synthetase n=2 Tax=Pseudomonas TaxID=286 RepID=A0A4Y9TBN0_PSEFL|nr:MULTISPECIES: ammonia-dependent NAD(+) synthetase [Pseudomonas]CRM89977.1 NH(3)-dependent NAD(+) synthetase [Pseudomonas sp. 22 E 5]MCX9152955.1 ammonia-dependent NAD(+) synthetase [Pseudomonas sp. TB1-B1]QXH69757.1 ammonia-dependent NAD(+) synthetase [Pseudomonas asgharzadehiana]TFW40452.1 ammonia-dependent NAD(+) synthetase [Pseudomonas fluorescens]TKJ57038.1 ammonia-dependent NAD(+) synthetase [Pseudomonas sp. CFBP13506]